MKITNNHRIPSPIPELAASSIYYPKDDIFRVTELCGPPMVRMLTKEKWDTIVQDAEDFLPALMGTAWHEFLDSHKVDGIQTEQRLTMELDGIVPIVSGGLDWFHAGTGWLNDWKTASTWVWVFGRIEWEQQLNVYAELLRQNGHKVSRLTDTVFFQGWSPSEAKRKPAEEYPPRRLMLIEQKLWPSEQVLDFIRSRFEAHSLDTPCTEEERWGRGGCWAIQKPGATRATKLCTTPQEAITYCQTKSIDPAWIVERPKTYLRCERYCSVRSVCPVALAMTHTESEE
jgi:hypothetical protein